MNLYTSVKEQAVRKLWNHWQLLRDRCIESFDLEEVSDVWLTEHAELLEKCDMGSEAFDVFRYCFRAQQNLEAEDRLHPRPRTRWFGPQQVVEQEEQ